MLTITLLGEEVWDEDANRFRYPNQMELQLEHSLVSLSKWEALYKRPFLGPAPMTEEETLQYLWAMVVTPGVTIDVFNRFTEADFQKVNDYINDPMTGTTFAELPGNKKSGEIISSELVYYWMSSFGISKDHETWHLNRLFTLIRVHHTKSQKPKKMSQAEQNRRNRELNAQRRAAAGSNG